MAYGDFKDLPRRAITDKKLRDKPFKITQKFDIWWISTRACLNGLLTF